MATGKGVIQGYTGVAAVDDKAQVVLDAQAHGTGSEQELLLPVVNATSVFRVPETGGFPGLPGMPHPGVTPMAAPGSANPGSPTAAPGESRMRALAWVSHAERVGPSRWRSQRSGRDAGP
jgi:hypothetical protein